ncbi:MAG: DUF3656 domain-containing protein [Erysipelotrichia bacterium]|nr:DUF3656 domain-containing protein [Erysipelotrichia bacterium]
MNKIEVLAPVGSQESLTAAVRCGADAVYLGAQNFSARRKAQNFSDEQLAQAVKYCHKSAVKVYVTVNIMLKQNELQQALDLIDYLYRINVDGIIVQDLGLARLIHHYYADLPLHGSTQMSIHQKSALKLLKEMGFSRIVVSREMSKQQLIDFCTEAKKENIEVEHFVHGALCMSVSGQCLLSAMLGSRSGNRGLCAQPCRLPFKVKSGTGHDLSLKDCSLFNYIDELRSIGICSLKIEGRMKRPEYVAITTYSCRQAVDGLKVDDDEMKMLKDVFSRSGFTDGYYNHQLGRQMFGVRNEEDVQSSQETFNKIHQLYRWERDKIGLNFFVKAEVDKELYLQADDGVNKMEIYGDIVSKTDKITNENDLKTSLSKLGNTGYYLANFACVCDKNAFVPRSQINQLRRQAVEKMNELRENTIEHQTIKTEIINIEKEHCLRKTYIRITDWKQLPANINDVDGLIVPLWQDIEEINKEIIAEIPRWFTDEKDIRQRMEYMRKHNVCKAYCNNLAAISVALDYNMEIIGGNYLNVANGTSCETLKDFGINEITASCELSLKEIAEIKTDADIGIISYGYLPLMLLINCPLKNGRKCSECDKNGYIVDRMNVKFPIRCYMQKYSELLNSTPIYLADKIDDYRNLDYQILYFTIEDKRQVEKIIDCYKDKQVFNKNFTRGLYYRSVK